MLSIKEIFNKEIVYKINNMDKICIQKNIVYKSVGKKEMLMDLYTPFINKKLPVVILIHGEASSVNFKESGQHISYGKLIAASGLNAVTFNHRVLSDGDNIKEVNKDIEELIKYLIENADRLNIDKDRIAIWCFSSGVPFGLYAGMNNNIESIKAIIAYYGFGDFKAVGKLLEIKIEEEDIEKYSPINLIDENSNRVPPLFIARAGLYNPIVNESIDNFITKGLKHNLNFEIYNHYTGGYAFDLFNDEERSYEIISESLNFLRKHL
ncbi:esterase [Clostridium sp. SHJSY1]|uniref:esterase n=1 Tax=Clostridium sp. SHJSY1 TaxID=2942483 RepID=UPI002876112A|nr:esterase [Clostridium sp. SHJSY1]MDS0525511.1 esterase [Clostridium sp. SHJSY1]